MTVDIRPASLTDVLEAVGLSRITQKEHAQRLPKEFNETDLPASTSLYPAIIKRRAKGAVFVATNCNTLVGHIGYYLLSVPAPSGHHHKAAVILDLSISPDQRGKGIGRRLINRALQEMKSSGVTRVDAQIWTGNTASEALFKSAGFDTVHREMRLHLAASRTRAPRLPGYTFWKLVPWIAIALGVTLWAFATR